MDRRLLLRAAVGSLALGVAPNSLLAESRTNTDLLYVDPELRTTFKVMKRVPPRPFDLAAERRGAVYHPPFKESPSVVRRVVVPSPAHSELSVYVINADSAKRPRPAIIHMHGGGFIGGSAKSSVRALQTLAEVLDVVIVTVEYRLSPEVVFPAALEDNYATLAWLDAQASELGVDPTRIAVMGESAGGGHAAMLAIAARDRRPVPLAFQVLIYPMIDDRTGATVKVAPQQGEIIWTAAQNRYGWEAFLGQPAGQTKVPYGSVPSRLDSLEGLAPAYIAVGTLDLFFNEDVEYARRLANSGVRTELHVVPGAYHGFDIFAPNAKITLSFRNSMISALRRNLNIPDL